MSFSDRLLMGFFGILVLLMLILAAITYELSADADRHINSVVEYQLKKHNLARKMQFVAQARTDTLKSMLITEDPFLRAEQWEKFLHDAQFYIQNREALDRLLSAEEQQLMAQIDQLGSEIVIHHHEIADHLFDGNEDIARDIMVAEVLEKNVEYFLLFTQLSEAQMKNAELAVGVASKQYLDIRKSLNILTTLSLIIAIVIGIYVFRRSQQLLQQLRRANLNLEYKVDERTNDLQKFQLELMASNNKLQKLATTDELTGLFNRNFMQEYLDKELARFQRYGQRFGIIMLDVDHFKAINDNFGHAIGDKVLKAIAQQLHSAIRTNDAIARWGGEEFLACCSGVNEISLQVTAEHLRQTINRLIVNEIPGTTITISLGCALVEQEDELNRLINEADQALYLAKRNGRNRVEVAARMESHSITDDNVTSIERGKQWHKN